MKTQSIIRIADILEEAVAHPTWPYSRVATAARITGGMQMEYKKLILAVGFGRLVPARSDKEGVKALEVSAEGKAWLEKARWVIDSLNTKSQP